MKIAVIRFSALGDIASMYPVIKSLKVKPTIITTEIGKMYYEDEFENIICLKSKKIIDVIKLILKIRKEKFDMVLDFQCNDRSRIITKLLGTRIYNNDNIDVFNNNTFNVFRLVAEKSELLNPIENIFKEKAKSYIVFNCGSSPKWFSKRLPIERWIEFSKYLNDKYSLPIYLVGDDSEYEYLENISKSLYGDVVNLAGKTTIKELKDLLRNAFLTLSTDSAAMHISAVQGTPTIGFFGATNWIRSAPYGEWSTVVYDKTYFNTEVPLKSNTMEVNHEMYKKLDLNVAIEKLQKYLK